MRVCRVHAPPVVDEHVEKAQHQYQETCRPFRLKPDGDHDTGREPDDGYEYASDAPFALKDESNEEENEEHATCEEEAWDGIRSEYQRGVKPYYFLRSVSLIEGRPAKVFFLLIIESLNTMKSPPMTLRLRRKKVRSKIRP